MLVALIGTISLLVQIVLLLRAEIGYSAQLRGFASVGFSSIIASVGPMAIGASYWLYRLEPSSSNAGRRASAILVAAQSLAIAATGFRGGAPLYLITVWLVGTRWPMARARGVRRGALAIAVMIAIPALFVLGAQERERVASLTGRLSEGSRVQAVSQLPNQVLKRFDLQPAVDAALDRASWPRARSAVSVETQLVAFVPRFLWPGKPEIDYGREVAYTFFDLPRQYRTASSITWLGDLYVQGGMPAILVVGLAIGYGLASILARTQNPTTVSIVVSLTLAQAFLNFESPVLILAATALRTVLALVLLYLATSVAYRIVAGALARPVRPADLSKPLLHSAG